MKQCQHDECPDHGCTMNAPAAQKTEGAEAWMHVCEHGKTICNHEGEAAEKVERWGGEVLPLYPHAPFLTQPEFDKELKAAIGWINYLTKNAQSKIKEWPNNSSKEKEAVKHYEVIRTALASRASVDVPDGWKLVPFDKPITNEMKAACIAEFSFKTEEPEIIEGKKGWEVTGGTYEKEHVVPWDLCKTIYKAMLKAAPDPAKFLELVGEKK